MIRAHGVSEAGPARNGNEDCLLSDEEAQLLVVADGMGGHSAGEVASRLAVDAIGSFVRRSIGADEFSWPYGVDPHLSYHSNRLRTAIHLANRRVLREAEAHDDYTGMGTTVVAAIVSGDRLFVGHVGDSRLYLLAGGRLEQVTEDDSWAVTVLARDPELAPAELENHPMRHVLTNVVGAAHNLEIHLTERSLTGGERILLCSDGLHGVVSHDALQQLMSAHEDEAGIARALVQAALENGTRDNVTALVAGFRKEG
jgi:PPM family protein phosphatase